MSRHILKEEEKKARLSITMNPLLTEILKENKTNYSKYIERLVYKDLKKDGHIKKDILL
jgi:hypothetical protein